MDRVIDLLMTEQEQRRHLKVVWKNMKRRCLHGGTVHYRSYAGISVCPEWINNFEAFVAHMGPRPGPGYSIDRYPNNAGNYEPGNVRWATAVQQMNNRRPFTVKSLSKKPSPKDVNAYASLLKRYKKGEIAKLLGISKQAITRWKAVPLRYARPLSEKTGISKADLLPSEFA